MTFLQYSSVPGKKSAIAFIIIACLTLSAFSQQVGSTQDQGRRYGDPGFIGEVINLRVVNSDIREILNYITEQYGVNFVIDKSVPKIPVTVNITDVPWNIALDSILRSQDLGVQVNGQILRIADSKALAAESEIAQRIRDNQLDSSPLYTEFIRLNYSRASGTLGGTGGQASQFQGGVTSNSGPSGSAGSSSNEQGLLPIVKRRLSRRGAIEIDPRSNTLIITDVRENIDAIRQLVILLDQPEPQVEIEARIVIASRNFSRDLGVQISALVLGRNGAAGSAGTFPGTTTGTGTTTGPTLNPGGFPGSVGPGSNNNLASSIINSAIGLTTGVFGTAQISALITAGENQGQAKTIATPRVTVLNNRAATFESGQQIPVVTSQTGANGGAVVFTTEYVSVPLRLAVTPQITDAGTVVLNVVAENNSISSTVVNGTPGISTQRMQTEVLIQDGGTTIVGGALLDIEGEDQFRTPGLSKVPILGRLFRRDAVARTTNEILFFITPRIYRPDYQGNPTSGTVSTGTRTTTILQPVPLGNPPSNSTNTVSDPVQQPALLPVQPAVSPVVPTTSNPRP